MRRLITMGCLSYLLTGCTHVILGAVLPELLRYYERTYNDGGMLVFAEFGGFLIGVLTAPALSRRISRRSTITTAFALLAIASVAITALPPWSIIVLLALIAGVAFGLVEASISTFVLLAAKEKQAIAFSQLEVFFGVGALVMPLISSFLIAGGIWKYSFLLLGASAVIMLLVWSRLSLGEHDELLAHKAVRDNKAEKLPPLSKSSLLFLCLFMLVFFVYVGMENTIVNFLPAIFKEEMHAASSVASLGVTAYWLTMVIGRIFAGVVAEKITYFRYLVISYAVSLLILLVWVSSTSIWSGFTLVLLLGIFMSGMFAVAIIYANKLLPGRTEQSTSLLIASGGLGGSVLPLAVGWAMDQFSVSVALWFVAFGMLLVLAIIVGSYKWNRKASHSDNLAVKAAQQ